MASTRRPRGAVSTLLALLLAVESVAAVSIAAGSEMALRSAIHPLPEASPAGHVLAEAGTTSTAWEPAAVAPRSVTAAGRAAVTHRPYAAKRPQDLRSLATPVPSAVAAPTAAKATPQPAATPAPAATATPKSTASAAPKPKTVSYVGRDHVWIPSLGIDQPVSPFPCTRSAAPDNLVYRWGCAGASNVYLLGHASGVFKPLHDAYVAGQLRTGLKVYYADDSGQTYTYAVSWWKLVRPTVDAAWAWAPQTVPSMTLQTCMGANSEYRLMVRLTRVA